MKTARRVILAFGLFASLAILGLADQVPGQKTPPSSKTADAARIDRLIRQLGSDAFTEREAAAKALEALGEAALPALRKAERDPDRELRRRVTDLIDKYKRRRAAMRAKAWERLKKVGDIYSNVTNLEDPIGALQFNHRACDDDLALIAQFPEAEGLELWGPELTDAGLVHVQNLRKLEMLHVASPKVTGSGFAHLKNLDRLFYVGLDESGVTDEGLVHLKKVKSLTHLILTGTRVTDAGLDHVREIKSLTVTLSLCGTRITNAGLAKLKGMNLYRLDLSRTQVTDAGLVHLKEIKNLHDLDLSDTAITAEGLPHLKAIPTLKEMSLRGTKVSERDQIELTKFLRKRASEENAGRAPH